ncbi:MAG: AtpZ/AtpI family protein [Pseudomonadota bacterium]
MSDDDHHLPSSDPQRDTPPSKDEHAALQRLGKRVKEARKDAGLDPDPTPEPGNTSGLAQGLRIGVEFVVAVVVGGGLGWGLDHLAGTGPWLFLLFSVFGVCAGVLNVMRMAERSLE